MYRVPPDTCHPNARSPAAMSERGSIRRNHSVSLQEPPPCIAGEANVATQDGHAFLTGRTPKTALLLHRRWVP